MSRRDDEEKTFDVELEDCEILAVSEAAVLIDYDDNEHWIPLSQIDGGDDAEYERGDIVDLRITQWIADKEGIEA